MATRRLKYGATFNNRSAALNSVMRNRAIFWRVSARRQILEQALARLSHKRLDMDVAGHAGGAYAGGS